MSAEPKLTSVLKLTDNTPKFVIMNAGKRKRYLHHDGDMDAASL